MNDIFPEFIKNLPKADIKIDGCEAYLIQGETQQIIFAYFKKDAVLSKHKHDSQWEIILDGKVDLIVDDNGRCTGAVLMNMETQTCFLVRAKKIILSTGGLGRLHLQKMPTTNHYGATADGIVAGYRAGGKLIYQDSVQFHPTGTAFPEQLIGLLVSEGLRGRGGHVLVLRQNRQ